METDSDQAESAEQCQDDDDKRLVGPYKAKESPDRRPVVAEILLDGVKSESRHSDEKRPQDETGFGGVF